MLMLETSPFSPQSVESTLAMATAQNDGATPFGLGAQYVYRDVRGKRSCTRCYSPFPGRCLCACVSRRCVRIAGQMKDFMTQITDWLFKHPVVRHQYTVDDHGPLQADDIVDSLVEHSRNELEK